MISGGTRTAGVDAAREHGELEVRARDREAEALVVVVGVGIPAGGLWVRRIY